MRTLAMLGLVTLPALPSMASAQEWSPEQQEVWEFELSCQESKQAWLDCFHEDYVAWADLSLGVPAHKADQVAIGGQWWDDHERLMTHLKPIEINVMGDFAVVLVVYTDTSRNRETGEIETTSEAWTDICIRENGRWYWIADHGTPLSGS